MEYLKLCRLQPEKGQLAFVVIVIGAGRETSKLAKGFLKAADL